MPSRDDRLDDEGHQRRRWTVHHRLAVEFTDALVQLIQACPQRALGRDLRQAVQEAIDLQPELESGRQVRHLLASEELLHPPHFVRSVVDALKRLALAGQVVELAAFLSFADLTVDPSSVAALTSRRSHEVKSCAASAGPTA